MRSFESRACQARNRMRRMWLATDASKQNDEVVIAAAKTICTPGSDAPTRPDLHCVGLIVRLFC